MVAGWWLLDRTKFKMDADASSRDELSKEYSKLKPAEDLNKTKKEFPAKGRGRYGDVEIWYNSIGLTKEAAARLLEIGAAMRSGSSHSFQASAESAIFLKTVGLP